MSAIEANFSSAAKSGAWTKERSGQYDDTIRNRIELTTAGAMELSSPSGGF